MLLVAVAAGSGCDKNAVQLIAGPPAGGASVKFFNFSVGSPAVNFYVNNTKYTAVSSTSCFNLAVLPDSLKTRCTTAGIESTSGVAYGGAGNGASGWYSDVASGQITIQGKIAATTDKDLAISNLQAAVAEGKYYSFYQSGIYNTTTKTTDSFMVEDNLPAFDQTVAYVRFVNAVANATGPMKLFARNRTTLEEVATSAAEIAYQAAGSFTAIPPGAYDLGARYAGVATNAISRTNVSFLAGRVYTVAARGNITVSSTLALDNTANR
jgi:hypothetical protein